MDRLSENQIEQLYEYSYEKSGLRIERSKFNEFIEIAYKEEREKDVFSDVKSYIDNVIKVFNDENR